MAQVDAADDFSGGYVDYSQGGAVGPGQTDAGIAVDWHVRRFPTVGGCDHFVPRHPAHINGGNLASRCGINQAEGVFGLIRHQQQWSLRGTIGLGLQHGGQGDNHP